jgi:hypothetical protein
MDEKLKASLEKALASGKDAAANLKIIIKNITKEVAKNTQAEGEDVKKSTNKLFKDILKALGELGKDSLVFLKAAGAGFKEGLKESNVEENNVIKDLGNSVAESLSNLKDAGVYVAKESIKGFSSVIEKLFKNRKSGL